VDRQYLDAGTAGFLTGLMEAHEKQASVSAAPRAVKAAIEQLDGAEPAAGLFFDCAATRL